MFQSGTMDVDIKSSLLASPPDSSTPAQSATGAPAIKRRAPIACRRCRRMRSKCLHDNAQPPCRGCQAAGLVAADCVFPVRGQPDNDREYRHPRARADKNGRRDPIRSRREVSDPPVARPPGRQTLSNGMNPADEWDLLPPPGEIIEAVNTFTRHYFQLGFIPKLAFTERLATNHRSVSVFLLLGILSISARFTPSLVERHGSGVEAAEMFMQRASAVALNELYKEPDLERCQGFYLLSIAQQGSGLKSQSSINMAIAMRMATLMQLHREETYKIDKPTKELIIRAESARRTLWMLHSQDNLHAGPASPVSLAAADITALLPCNEEDFANGVEPGSRAALKDTPPAIENPKLLIDPRRSLFAILIQSHYLWGTVSRRAVGRDKSACPWRPDSEYAKMETRLRDWEEGLPHVRQWSNELLEGYKAGGEDLAYLGLTMITRLCNIVLRRAYLGDIISAASGEPDPALRRFWAKMSLELFSNVRTLYEQIDTQFKAARTNENGRGVQMMAFSVYSCGFFACYLCKYPNICIDPDITRAGPAMVQRCVTILAESQDLWPLASRWLDGLEKFRDQTNPAYGVEGSMADGREPIPHVLHPAIKPAQTRIHPPPSQPMDDKRSLQALSPGPSILPPPHPSPLAHTYIDPSLRLPAPQPQLAPATMPTPQQQHQLAPHHHNQQHHHHLTSGRPSTDGLGLLLEAFGSTHQAGAIPPNLPPSTAAAAFGPPGAAPHEFYSAAEAMPLANDAYEYELQCYMSNGISLQHGWVGGGMYSY